MRWLTALLLSSLFIFTLAEDEDFIDPRPATRVTEMYPLVCFSIHSHLTCPIGTLPFYENENESAERHVRQFRRHFARPTAEVDFVCMPNHRRTRELLKQLASGKVVKNVRSKQTQWIDQEVEMKIEIETMDKCVRA
ncbi:hypothetical protein M3Y98_00790900 [Aphelenchoides besseyi]|nr:hypothetical protein M3Y98_00790900 [Aphelenchoides besseyi]